MLDSQKLINALQQVTILFIPCHECLASLHKKKKKTPQDEYVAEL